MEPQADPESRTAPANTGRSPEQAAEPSGEQPVQEPAPVPTAFGATSVGAAVAASAMAGPDRGDISDAGGDSPVTRDDDYSGDPLDVGDPDPDPDTGTAGGR